MVVLQETKQEMKLLFRTLLSVVASLWILICGVLLIYQPFKVTLLVSELLTGLCWAEVNFV